MTIQEAIEEYKKNIIEEEELTEALFTERDKEKWISLLYKRAERVTDLYAKNNELIDFAKKEIKNANDQKIDDAFEALYELYLDGFDDVSLMVPLLEVMEEHYKKIKEYGKTIVSYSMHAYECHEFISRLDPSIPFDIGLYKGVLDLKSHYKEIELSKHRWNFFGTYFNIIAAAESIPGVSPLEVYKYLLEAEELYESPEVQELDKDDELINQTMEEIKRGFLVYHERYSELPDEIKEELYKRSKSYILFDDFYKSPFMPFVAYNRCLYERGEITKTELLHRYEVYFMPIMENFFKEELSDERITQGFEAVGTLLRCLHLPGEADIDYYYGKMKEFFRQVDNETKLKRLNPFINAVISDYIIHALPFEKNKEEIEQTIFDNLIKRQAPTYIHSVMVMMIAEIIYEYMDKSLLPKLANPLEYIKNSALLHDVGKSQITSVINMQRRRLTDSEFNSIRNHPHLGEEIIKENPLLKEYHDVIIGHHKWYNGKGGYPFDFDNTKSEYRIIIDLITIADCLDAATDRFGRNYKHPKSVLQVLEEFKEGSGTRYNPYFVNLLSSNQELIYRLEDLTQYKRPEYMYRAYMKQGF